MLKRQSGLCLFIIVVICLTLAQANKAHAVPTLQLDIGGGTYDTTTETIVTGSSEFSLYALLVPDRYNNLSDTYYVSIAITPQLPYGNVNLGSFSVNGTVIDVTSDMTYGVPPLENIAALQGWDAQDLPKHGIYPTYFYEYGFSFSSADRISKYNTQDRAISGGLIDLSYKLNGGMYYAVFDIDSSFLSAGYNLHFDLYNTRLKSGGDTDINQFAPFSHDAETRQVPEPGTVLLLGAGLTGLALLRRKLFNRTE